MISVSDVNIGRLFCAHGKNMWKLLPRREKKKKTDLPTCAQPTDLSSETEWGNYLFDPKLFLSVSEQCLCCIKSVVGKGATSRLKWWLSSAQPCIWHVLSLWMVLEGPDLGHLLMEVEQWCPSSCAMHRHCLGWEGGYDCISCQPDTSRLTCELASENACEGLS